MNTATKIVLVTLLIFASCKQKKDSIKTVEVEKAIKSPNILIIYPDQLRRYSASFWSKDQYISYVQGKPDPVLTPVIDKLAEDGAVFTQAVSNFPLCSPARGMILSGMYPEQNGIWNNCRNDRDESLKDDIPTITDLFFEAGYNTSYFGKCHWLKNEPLFDENGDYQGTTEAPGGHHMNRYDTYIPPKSRHNIEYFYQAIRDLHYDPLVYSSNPNAIDGKKDGELHQPKIFSPKNEANKIISYLRNTGNVRDTKKPFFMMWSINPPHNPWGDDNTDMETLHKFYGEDKYPVVDSLLVRENADVEVGHYARHYFANVTSVDNYIGQVLDELKRLGEFNNTIVILSADHGEMMGSHGRQGKNAFETESLGVPFIVHWPEKIKGRQVNNTLYSVVDVLPTVMGLSGLEDNIPSTVEGTDFSGALLGDETSEVSKPEGVLLMLGNSRGILTDRYTLCLKEHKKPWDKQEVNTLEAAYFYDNLNDPYQLNKIPLNQDSNISKKLLELLVKKLEMSNDPWYQEKKYDSIIPYNP